MIFPICLSTELTTEGTDRQPAGAPGPLLNRSRRPPRLASPDSRPSCGGDALSDALFLGVVVHALQRDGNAGSVACQVQDAASAVGFESDGMVDVEIAKGK